MVKYILGFMLLASPVLGATPTDGSIYDSANDQILRYLTGIFRIGDTISNPATNITLDGAGIVTANEFVGPLTGNADTATSVAASGVNMSTVTARFQLVEASTGNLYATKLSSNTAIPAVLVDLSTITAALALKAPVNAPTFTGTAQFNPPELAYAISANGIIDTSSSIIANQDITANGAFYGHLVGYADTVTTNANLTGPITSVGNATTIVGPVPASGVDLSTVTVALALKAPIANPTFTGAVSGPSSATFNAFFGDGSALTGVTSVDSSKVAKTGDTMTGTLTQTVPNGGTGLDVLTASGIGVTGTGIKVRARADGKAIIVRDASNTQDSIVLNGDGVTLLTGFSMPGGGDGGNMTLGVPAFFNAGLSVTESTATRYYGNGGALLGITPWQLDFSTITTQFNYVAIDTTTLDSDLTQEVSDRQTADALKVDKNTPEQINLSTVTVALGLKADKGNTSHIDLSTVTSALALKADLAGGVFSGHTTHLAGVDLSSGTVAGMLGFVGGAGFSASPSGQSRIYGLSGKGLTLQGEQGASVQASLLDANGARYYWEATNGTDFRLAPDGDRVRIGSRSAATNALSVTGNIDASGTIAGSNLSGTNTGDQTNITGNAATVTTNANLTGPVTSVGNATTIVGPVYGTMVDLSTVTTALASKQAADADLDDLADGSLTGSKVGDGVPAANIAAGNLPNDVIVSSVAAQIAAGTCGSATISCRLSYAADGRITSVSSETITGTGGGGAPTRQILSSGSGTYTTPADVSLLKVSMVGGGGSGGCVDGSGGNAGGNTVFGSTTAYGGALGAYNPTSVSAGGAYPGGSTSSASVIRIKGADGEYVASWSNHNGANGGTNTGKGGTGGKYPSGGRGGGDGADGEFVSIFITSPASSYSYSIASAAAACTGTYIGGTGGTGFIVVEEFY